VRAAFGISAKLNCISVFVNQKTSAIIRNCHPELVSGSMSYRKGEMLKKFQHDTNIVKVSIFDYGLWHRTENQEEGAKKRWRSFKRKRISAMAWVV